jgi:hypothetical protein
MRGALVLQAMLGEYSQELFREASLPKPLWKSNFE